MAGEELIVLATQKPIEDSLPPVAVSAILHPALVDSTNYLSNPEDTLVVSFSESVNNVNGSNDPFGLIKADSTDYSLTLVTVGSDKGTSMTFLVSGKTVIPKNGDLIYIKSTGNVSDILNFVQKKDTYPIPLKVEPYRYIFRSIIYPNPLRRMADDKLLKDKESAFAKYNIPVGEATADAQAFIITPYGVVLDINDISAKISIYDAVGNIIVDKVALKFTASGSTQYWYYVWDGENSMGRKVGAGTYIGQLIIKNGLIETVQPIRVGVAF